MHIDDAKNLLVALQNSINAAEEHGLTEIDLTEALQAEDDKARDELVASIQGVAKREQDTGG